MKRRFSLMFFLVIKFGLAYNQMPSDTAKSKRNDPKKFEEFITDVQRIDLGLVNVYFSNDKYFWEIPNDILGRDILCVSRISKGAAGVKASMLGYAGDEINNLVVRWDKGRGNKLFLKRITLADRSKDSTMQMFSAVSNSNIHPIIESFDVKAYSKDKKGVLIDVTDFLSRDNDQVFFSANAKSTLRIGGIQSDKSYIGVINSYPINTEIRTFKTYSRTPFTIPGINVIGALGDPEPSFVSFEINTSLVLLPETPMKSRADDTRVGYFSVGYTDFDENPQGISYVSIIKKWRLEVKPEDLEKYKRGELVEPVKPIIFYIDPATPSKWVPYLIQGVNDWQKAFEQAGFKNAIMARRAPTKMEDSTWSLEDARHSAIVYKPSRTPNASGPSIADPRSGEIIESHINWYHNVMSLLRNWYIIQASPSDPRARKMKFDDELMGQLIRFVSSHEVGHTLGLLHNFGSSSTVPVDSLRSATWLKKNGHTPSIMDYARFNYVAQPEDKIEEEGIFPRIGDYDQWAIEYGYRILPDMNLDQEKTFLNKWIIEKNKNRRLWFGSEDNLQDPRNQTEGLGNDPIKASEYGIKNLKFILPNLEKWAYVPNEGYENYAILYKELTDQFERYIGHVIKIIGGEYYTPKAVEEAGPVYEVVSKEEQLAAIKFMGNNVFNNISWLIEKDVSSKINVDPLGLIKEIQVGTLNKLLSESLMLKLHSQEAKIKNAFSILDLFSETRNLIWDSKLSKPDQIDIYLRDLQKAYISNLFKLAGSESPGSGGGNPNLPKGFAIRNLAGETNKTDIPSLAKAEMKLIKSKISLILPKVTDKMVKYHLMDCFDRLNSFLSIK